MESDTGVASDPCSVCDTPGFSTSWLESCPMCDKREFSTTHSREIDVVVR